MSKWTLPAFFGATLLLGGVALAAGTAAGGGLAEGSRDATLLAEIALLMLLGRGLGELLQRWGQPAVVGQLVAGLVLGPSLFGWIAPQAHAFVFPDSASQKELISGLSTVGVLLLLLLTGMETDLRLARRVGTAAVAVAAFGVAVPFLLGFGLGEIVPASILPDPRHRLVTALLLGTALSISSIKIVAVVVREMHFMRRNLGQIIVASAILEDTGAWVIISVIFGIASAGGVAILSLAKTLVGTALFLVLSYTVGRRLVFWLIRWVNDNFVSEYAVVTAILVVMCALSLITEALGVNVVLGAFVTGVLVGESPILSGEIEDELRGFITAFMMPIFFGLSGLSADLTILRDGGLALLTLGLIVIASLGKFAGAFGGGIVGGLSARESLALGCGMNARGSTEVIVASLGLSAGVFTQNLYTMIVSMAIVTTMAMPPTLRWALLRVPLREKERLRLENEEMDARGFVSRFERLLVAGDEGANGNFASQIAGIIAGQRGIPITVLHLNEEERPADPATEPLRETAAQAASDGRRAASSREEEQGPGRVEVSSQVETRAAAAISRESAKGYDALFIGVERMRNPGGNFSAEVDEIAAGFEGSLALALADRARSVLSEQGLKILIAVNGTEAARHGAEMAFAYARVRGSGVTALYVAEASVSRTGVRGSERGVRKLRRSETAILDDIAALAKRYGCERITTAVRTEIAPGAAIVEEARRRSCDLVVIGATRRVGAPLSLGQTVATVLQDWRGALLLVAS